MLKINKGWECTCNVSALALVFLPLHFSLQGPRVTIFHRCNVFLFYSSIIPFFFFNCRNYFLHVLENFYFDFVLTGRWKMEKWNIPWSTIFLNIEEISLLQINKPQKREKNKILKAQIRHTKNVRFIPLFQKSNNQPRFCI